MSTHAIIEKLLPKSLTNALIALILAFLCGALLIAIIGVNPITAYGTLFQASLGSANGIAETAIRAVPLSLCALGIAMAFRAGVFNVGAEGQLYLGGIAAAFVGVLFAGSPQPLVITSMILAAMVAGALWSGIAAFLKLKFNSDELITTIMLNYIGIHFVTYLLHGPLQDPNSPLAQTARLGVEARLPNILEGTRLHAGVFLVILSVIIAHFFLWKSVSGFKFRATGINKFAAKNVGINTKTVIIGGFLICGALAGLAGFAEVAGVQRRMIENLSPGYGYTAIIIALLGQTNPIGVLASAILFAALQVGSSTLQSAHNVPSSLVTIIQALVVLFLLAQNTFPLVANWFMQLFTKVRGDV